jgi:hypothetical protein
MLLLTLLPLLIGNLNNARAEDASSEQFKQFTTTDFYQGLLNNTFSKIPEIIFRKCPALVSKGSTVTVIKPVSFGPDGFPNSGIWKQTFPVSGCDNDTILNLYFKAGSDEKINSIIGSSGTTHADLALQNDAYKYAVIGAGTMIKQCDRLYVRNTRFEDYGSVIPAIPDPGSNSPTRPWHETWTMAGCGHIVDVPLSFVPDGKGTQVIMQPGGVIEK